MDVYEPFLSLGLALAAGLLIGFEREASAPPQEARAFLGGARTHPLFALVGAVSTLLSPQLGVGVVLVALLALLSLMGLSFYGDIRQGKQRGLTSEAAFLLSFLLGALAMAEGVFGPVWLRAWVVGALAVTATVLLSIKPALHAFVHRVSREDILATLKLLVLAVVFLPLLPNRAFGPLDVLHPFRIGLFAVFVAGISFTGYVAIRLVGPQRGLGLTGLVGGLASSTAVTLSFSGRARQAPELQAACALAVVLASTVMFPRVLAVVAFVSTGLVPALVVPMTLMTVAGLGASLLFWRHARRRAGDTEVELRNPFRLKWALGFALLFAGVDLVAKAALHTLGPAGAYVAAVLAGLTDVNAITLSMAHLADTGQVSREVATTSIFLGAAANTASKAAIAAGVGGRAFARQVVLALAGVLLAGALGVGLMWLR